MGATRSFVFLSICACVLVHDLYIMLHSFLCSFLWSSHCFCSGTRLRLLPQLEHFFYAAVALAVLSTLLIILVSTIRLRAQAIAESRTADLLETQKLFVELYRNSPVPYVMIDHNGKVTYPNHAATHLFGIEESSFEGLDILIYL